jgi:acetoin utilization deacetylase AcuC-like enzyme
MADQGMGFCVYNNAVVAARQAQRNHGAERVLILDWDVHHGNGTQAAFWSDPSVLFISLHQDDLYPAGWGAADQLGAGDGEGFTVNIPLPAGAGNRFQSVRSGPGDCLGGAGCQRFRPVSPDVADTGWVSSDDRGDDGDCR